MPTWIYTLIGRIVWKRIPVVLRRELAARGPKLAAGGVVALVLVVGLILARSDRLAAAR